MHRKYWRGLNTHGRFSKISTRQFLWLLLTCTSIPFHKGVHCKSLCSQERRQLLKLSVCFPAQYQFPFDKGSTLKGKNLLIRKENSFLLEYTVFRTEADQFWRVYPFPLYTYRIRSNYHTYPYTRTVKTFRSLQITASVIFLYFFLKAYVVGTHLNCIDLSMQFKWVLTTYAFIKKIRNNHIIIIKLVLFLIFFYSR